MAGNPCTLLVGTQQAIQCEATAGIPQLEPNWYGLAGFRHDVSGWKTAINTSGY